MTVEIRTNNKPRLLIDDYQLTPDERKEFDYLNWQAIEAGNDSATFFRYKGQLYDLGEFMRCPDTAWFKGWDGYYSDSAFSGVLVRYCQDTDYVVIGMYFS